MPIHPPPSEPSRQLLLPLDLPRLPLPPPLPASTIAASQAWRSLAPDLQAAVRQALLHVAQEVLRDALSSREDHRPAP